MAGARVWLSFSAFAIALVAARLFFGHTPDKLGGAKVALVSVFVEAAGLGLIWFASTAVLAAAGAALTGFGYALVYPGLGVEAVRRVPPQSRGLAMGAYTVFLDVALGFGSPVLGLTRRVDGLRLGVPCQRHHRARRGRGRGMAASFIAQVCAQTTNRIGDHREAYRHDTRIAVPARVIRGAGGPTRARDDVRAVAPALEKYRQDTLFGDLWKRPGLSPRDRSIVTLAALITRNQTAEMAHYLNLALDNGVKPSEVSEIVTHLAFYAGWGNSMAAVAIAKDVFAARKITADQIVARITKTARAQRSRRGGSRQARW